jgi:hypothetical protein
VHRTGVLDLTGWRGDGLLVSARVVMSVVVVLWMFALDVGVPCPGPMRTVMIGVMAVHDRTVRHHIRAVKARLGNVMVVGVLRVRCRHGVLPSFF